MVGADVDRIQFRDVLQRVGDRVGRQAHARPRRERVRTAAHIFLENVVLDRAPELLLSDPLLLGRDDIQREQPRGRGVRRDRGVHLRQRNAMQQRPHVALVRDRDADLANLAQRELVVRVIANLSRQIKRDRQPSLTLRQIHPVQLIRALGVRVPGVRTHHPRPIRLGEARKGRVHGPHSMSR